MDPSGLRRLAGRTHKALGIVEKDQALTLLLGALAEEPAARDLVFKGGTALSKVYFPGYRFSEDLDFTASRDVAGEVLDAAPRILEAGRRAGVRLLRIERLTAGRSGRTLKVRYADMNGHPNHILVQLSLREAVRLPAEPRSILDAYGVVPPGTRISTMDLREVAAEKVRSLLMRSQARDLYDLWFLLRHEVGLDADLIEAKLDWWKKSLSFDPAAVSDRVARLGATWARDLEPLLGQVPPFEAVARDVGARLGGARRGESGHSARKF